MVVENLTTLEELAAAHGIGSNFFFGLDVSALILSGWFAIFLVMFILIVVFLPLGIFGASRILNWFDVNFRKPASGYIKVYQDLPNDRVRQFWVRPTGRMITFKSFSGKMDISQPLNTDKGFMKYEGNVPFIRLDKNNKQIFMGEGLNLGSDVAQEEVTRGYKMAYDTGKMVGATDAFAELKTLLIVAIAASFLGVMITGYLVMDVSKKVDLLTEKVNGLPNAESIAREFINQTSSRQPFNTQIPTVGGR